MVLGHHQAQSWQNTFYIALVVLNTYNTDHDKTFEVLGTLQMLKIYISIYPLSDLWIWCFGGPASVFAC